MKLTALAAVLFCTLDAFVAAHPESDTHYTPEQLAKRQLELEDRHEATRSCTVQIDMFNSQRREARGMKARSEQPRGGRLSDLAKRFPLPGGRPYYSHVHNTTVVATPEVTEGPYYVHNELVRPDLREGQQGVTLVLDIGVVDIRTCKPIPNAYVEIWATNSTGYYSGFTEANDMGMPGGHGPPPGGNGSHPHRPPPDDARPGGGRGPPHASMTDQLSWLRGGQPTNGDGIVELFTLYPGFYEGRTIHIHTAVITQWQANENGTIISDAGHLRHVGQIFFDDSFSSKVIETAPYNTNTKRRTLNEQDGVFAKANSGGYNALAEVTLLGSSLADGLLGYITIGVDTSNDLKFRSTAYWEPEKEL